MRHDLKRWWWLRIDNDDMEIIHGTMCFCVVTNVYGEEGGGDIAELP